jgi:hypothetical protein
MRYRHHAAIGITLGNIIAAIISWTLNHSLIWAVIHFFFSWFYVVYAMVVYYHLNLVGLFNAFVAAIARFFNAL